MSDQALRAAAQQLPDVGPVTRDGDSYVVDQRSYPADRDYVERLWRDQSRYTSQLRAVLAAMDSVKETP